MNTLSKEDLQAQLTVHDRQHCFRDLGFQLKGQTANDDGFITHVKGPAALGEGKSGNFSVNTRTGSVKDFGGGYTNDLFGAVQDVRGCTFPEALEWITERAGASPANGTDTRQREKPVSEPDADQQAVPRDDIERWSQRLWDNEKRAAEKARQYLTDKRGLDPQLLRARYVGLRFHHGKTWICFPVYDAEADAVTLVKRYAFDVSTGDWKRNGKGKKIVRTDGGGSELYWLLRGDGHADGPLVLTEGEIDALSVHQVGYNAVTGTAGAGTFSEAWAHEMAGAAASGEGVVILYDGDAVGRGETEHSEGYHLPARLLTKAGCDVYVANPGDDVDANDLWLGGGREAVVEVIQDITPYEPAQTDNEDSAEVAPDPDFFPPRLYELLPDTLRIVTEAFENDRERAVFLAGALPVVAGACPNVLLRYGRQWQALNLYCLAVAPPGSGKGALRHAQRMGDKMQDRLVAESRKKLRAWKERRDNDDQDAGPRPSTRSFFLAGDTSAAGLKEELAANSHGVVFETEIKTLTTALSQDWGQYRDVLLKSAHNEPLTIKRKGEEPGYTKRPALSVGLSGTPRSFSEIITDAEDGLFSRCFFLAFSGGTDFRNMFEDDSDAALDAALETAGNRLNELRKKLEDRDEPLYVKIGDAEEKRIVKAGEYATRQVKRSNIGNYFLSNVRRAALRAFRIAALLRLMRMLENEARLATTHTVEVSADDVEAGLIIALTCLEHAAFLSGQLRDQSRLKGLSDEKRNYFKALPAGTFDTATAEDVAKGFSFSERSARRYLKAYAGRGLLADVRHGQWRKPKFAPASFLSFLSFSSKTGVEKDAGPSL